MELKKVKILRTSGNDKETLGVLTCMPFVCKTLELPWKDNCNSISCFVPGKYLCRYTKSESFSKMHGKDFFTYEIIGVPGRAGIRIHSANYVSELRGCIALGDAHKDINLDALIDVTHSGATIVNFENLMNYEDFELEIIKAY